MPPAMIATATARRRAGDWAGACAAAGVDVDLDLRALARARGTALAAAVRADLRHLAPDLLRWHLPRVAPDGLLRPGLTLALAGYDPGENPVGGRDSLHLVVRTPPAWAAAGQRIMLTLWDGTALGSAARHPHPRPHRRHRLDLHRHLWDARRAPELRTRSGAAHLLAGDPADPGLPVTLPPGCAVHRWAAEAALLLAAPGTSPDSANAAVPDHHRTRFLVRCGARRRLVFALDTGPVGSAAPTLRLVTTHPRGAISALPILPDAATWNLPDLDLLRTGALSLEHLHPLVAQALGPDGDARGSAGRAPRAGDGADPVEWVSCRGADHRIGPVDGVLAALDHDPAEIRREELLAALTGTPLPCLRAIDTAHRRPDWLTGVRERLDHGDIAGALAVVERMLGPEAVLRDGPLRDALETCARQRVTYGLFRAGLPAPGAGPDHPVHRPPRRTRRTHPRRAPLR
ncbi:hypothetical protein [Nocardia thailandica]|uniref:hypothetical protein n=1 Tax=Nocardia thailandica TaxID=257275 RepID=UPI0002EE03F7|nr:hypothetical protein [Nocardia thailandica]